VSIADSDVKIHQDIKSILIQYESQLRGLDCSDISITEPLPTQKFTKILESKRFLRVWNNRDCSKEQDSRIIQLARDRKWSTQEIASLVVAYHEKWEKPVTHEYVQKTLYLAITKDEAWEILKANDGIISYDEEHRKMRWEALSVILDIPRITAIYNLTTASETYAYMKLEDDKEIDLGTGGNILNFKLICGNIYGKVYKA
jgi:hypothetical protein